MTSLIEQDNNLVDYQQPVLMPEENSRRYAVMNNVPLCSSNVIAQEQQIVYVNAPVNDHPIDNQSYDGYQQQLTRGQICKQYVSTNSTAQHNQQQVSSVMNMPPSLAHQT
jgi:hypothetical protein